ncbi:MAG: PKD domain-containing protein, partial [Crocinitomicaceae bacterium]|nr:PKD domain-containing protein [Crocinitomicaceae bacterium]
FNAIGEYTVSLNVTNAVGTKSLTKEAFITVNPALTSQVCDTLTNFLTSEPKAYVPIIGGGSYAGHVSNKLKSFVESYANAGNYTHITGAFLDFARAETTNPNSTINVKVFANSGGSPGTVLATKSVKITDIRQDVLNARETKVMFDTPIAVSGQFFVGFDVTYAAGDTVGVYTTKYGAAGTNTAFFQFSGGSWCAYGTCWSKTHLKISPLVAVLPSADFSISSASIHPNESVTFNASTSKNAATYNWTFQGTSKLNSVSQIVTNSFTAPGTYNVVLNVTNGCGTTASKTSSLTVTSLCDAGNITGDSTVCIGNTLILTPTVSGGSWSTSDNTIASIDSGTLTSNKSGSVIVTYSISESCMVNKTITVNSLPDTPTLSGPSVICMGSTAVITPSISGGQWSSSNIDFVTVNNGVIQGVLDGTIDISYAIGNEGCSSVTTKAITVEVKPVLPLISGPSKICWNGKAMMRASVAGGVWGVENSTLLLASPQGLFRNSVKPATDNFKSGVNYTITSRLGACSSKAVKNVYVRNVTAPSITISASKTSLKVNEVTTATVTTAITSLGTWSSTNTVVGATSNLANTKTASVKGLRVGTGANVVYFADDVTTGCRQAGYLAFSVTAAISMVSNSHSEVSMPVNVRLYPNPSNGKFMIQNSNGVTFVKLLDLSGRLIATQPIVSGTTTIDFSGVTSGKYMVQISGDNFNEIQPIVIE